MTNRQKLLFYSLLSIILIAVGLFQYGLIALDQFSFPPGYQGDGLFAMAIAKLLSMNYYFYGMETERLGFPFGSSLDSWYPIPEKLIFGIYAVLTKAFGLYPATNIMMLLTHVLAGVGFAYAALRISIRPIYAFLLGIAFALTPFIFMRGLAHITVGAVWLVPSMVVIIYSLFKDINALKSGSFWLFCLVVSVLAGAMSPYYLILYFQFLIFAIIYYAIIKEYKSAKKIMLCIFWGSAVFVLANASNIYTKIVFGGPSFRNLAALEVYALKIPELFLPITNRFSSISSSTASIYYDRAFVKGELWSPYLGIVGIFFLINLIVDYLKAKIFNKPSESKIFAPILIYIVIFSLVGGLNLLFGVFGFQFIRATNRFSIFILAISLLYGGLKLTKLEPSKFTFKTILISIVILSSVSFDVPRRIDATTKFSIRAEAEGDIALMKFIENNVKSPKILVLPAMNFPENGPNGTIIDYDPLRVFLSSDKSIQVYGSVKFDNSPKIADPKSVDTAKFFEEIKAFGINVILLNNKLNINDYDKYSTQLNDSKFNEIHKANGYTVYYNGPSEQLFTTKFMYGAGWSEQETGWRWALSNNPDIYLFATQEVVNKYKSVTLNFKAQSIGLDRSFTVSNATDTLYSGKIDSTPSSLTIEIPISKGMNKINFTVTGPKVKAGGGDSRMLTFRIFNPEIHYQH